MKHSMLRIALLALMLSACACNSRDPEPEKKDQVFMDLKKRHEEHQKAKLEAQSKATELRKSLEKADPNSLELKDIRRDLAKTQNSLLDHEQMERYYRIRMDRRKVVDSILYDEARAEGKEWSTESDYSGYLTNQRLREAHMNWNKRVPRLQDRLERSPSAEKKSDKPAAETTQE